MNIFKRKNYVVTLGEDKDTKKRIEKLESLVAFLCRHNRDEVVLKEDGVYPSFSAKIVSYTAVYIANDEVKGVHLGNSVGNEKADIIYNKKYIAIARIGKSYYMIDKTKGTATNISELYVGGEMEDNKKEEADNEQREAD